MNKLSYISDQLFCSLSSPFICPYFERFSIESFSIIMLVHAYPPQSHKPVSNINGMVFTCSICSPTALALGFWAPYIDKRGSGELGVGKPFAVPKTKVLLEVRTKTFSPLLVPLPLLTWSFSWKCWLLLKPLRVLWRTVHTVRCSETQQARRG